MVRRFAAVAVALSGAWTVAAGCAANGSDAQVNGPEYDFDAASDAGGIEDASAPSDGAQTPPADASPSSMADGGPSSEGASTADGATSDADDGSPGEGDGAGGCTATTAILGGNDFALFGATAVGTGGFTTQTITGSLGGAPALVPFGGGFQGLLAEAIDAGGADALYGVGFGGGTWSTPTALGGSADALGAPGAAVVGSTVQAVYLNAQHFYFHATFNAAWDTGADPVRPPNDAGVTAFGPVAAAAAGTASQLVIAYEGNNLLPYAQTWTSGSGWDDGVSLGTAAVAANTPMAIVALDAGASDLLAVYVDGEGSTSGYNTHLFYVLRTASTKAWASPVEIGSTVYTPSAATLTAMSGGRALVAWQGFSGGVYGSVFTSGAATPWSTAVEITTASPTSAPSLAPGVCGDDAEAAYVSNDNIYTTHFVGGAWSTPVALSGGSGATAATIATAP